MKACDSSVVILQGMVSDQKQACPVCKTKLDNLYCLVEHFAKTHCQPHLKKYVKTNKCTLCPLAYTTVEENIVHSSLCHEAIKLSFVTWTCKICNCAFNMKDEILKHFAHSHQGETFIEPFILKAESKNLQCQIGSCPVRGSYQYMKAHMYYEHCSKPDLFTVLRQYPLTNAKRRCAYCTKDLGNEENEAMLFHYFIDHNLILMFMQPFKKCTVDISPQKPVPTAGAESMIDVNEVLLLDEDNDPLALNPMLGAPENPEIEDYATEPTAEEESDEEAEDLPTQSHQDSFWVNAFKGFCKQQRGHEAKEMVRLNFAIINPVILDSFLLKVTANPENITKVDTIVGELESLAPTPLEGLETVQRHLLLKEYHKKSAQAKCTIFNTPPMQIVIFMSQSMVKHKKEDILWLIKRISLIHEFIDGKPLGLNKKILDFFTAIEYPLDESFFKSIPNPSKESKLLKTDPAIKCELCKKTFKTNMGLKVHMKKEHTSKPKRAASPKPVKINTPSETALGKACKNA